MGQFGPLRAPVTDDFALNSARIDMSESFNLCWAEKRRVRDIAEMIGNEPNVLFRGHPVVAIETREIHRTRVAAESALAAQVEIDMEVTQRQLAQGSVNRFAISATGEVRLSHCAPMTPHFEDGKDVIGVVVGFQIQKQRRVTKAAESGRGEDGALEAMGGAFAQNNPRRPCCRIEMIRHRVEEALDIQRSLERAQGAELCSRKHEEVTIGDRAESENAFAKCEESGAGELGAGSWEIFVGRQVPPFKATARPEEGRSDREKAAGVEAPAAFLLRGVRLL